MPVAVIDIGKTNAKVVLVSDAGEELDRRRIPNVVRPGPPYPHFDVDRLWAFILDALRDFAPRVRAIVPVTHGACAALVDEAGELVLSVLDYEHDGPDARGSYEPPPFEETGSPPLPGGLNVGAQLHWLEATFPQAFGRARQLLFWPQYWAFRLSGVMASEITSLGCHTDLWAPADARPSTLARARGWDRLLPPIRGAGETLGLILPKVSVATSLYLDTTVHAGIHDSNASLLPYLGEVPCAVVSTGTWVIVMALGGKRTPLDPNRDTLMNVAADGRVVPTARFMGGRERDVAIAAGTGLVEADRTIARRTAERLAEIGACGSIFVEGPFAANETFLAELHQQTNRPVRTRGSGTGTTRGGAMLAALSYETHSTRRAGP